MRIVVAIRIAIVVVLAAVAPELRAQANLLTNGNFDATATGWNPLGTGSVQRSSLDASGNPGSGSLLVTNTNPAATNTYGYQCLALAGARTYYAAASIRIPSGQAQTGYAYVTPQWYAQPGCSGSPVASQFTSNVSALDTWTRVSVTTTAPASAQSVAFYLAAAKTVTGGQFQVLFDDVSLVASVPATLTVPASASIHGSKGSFFHSDLWVMNRSYTNAQTITARLRCYAGQSCGSATKSFGLQPRQTVLYEDVVGGLFASPETAGAIELTYDTIFGQVTAGTRVYTPSLPAPTNGTSIPALPASEARSKAVFIGLGSNGGDLSSGFRSNAGAYNPSGVSTSVTFTLHDGATGAVLGTPLTRTWGANEAYQINDVFTTMGTGATVTTNAYLVVTSGVPVFPYVTVIDNQSGDSVYVPAASDEPPAPVPSFVTNGGFDATTSGWTMVGTGSLSWSPLDASGSGTSGSILVTNSSSTAGAAVGGLQCIAVPAETSYTISGRGRVPSGQTRTGYGWLLLYAYAAPSCMGSVTYSAATAHASAIDTWTVVGGPAVVPAGTQSLGIYVAVAKAEAGGALQVLWDDVSLVPVRPATLTVPASASIHGSGGAFFHSDLWAMNRSATDAQTVTARFRCYTGQSCPSGTSSFTLQPRQSVLYEDVISGLFASPETAGAIELTYDTAQGPLVAGTRVYTPSLPSPTNGASIPALAATEARTRALFLGLADNGGDLSSGFRTNAGAYNPNASSASVTFTFHNGASAVAIGTPVTRTLGPNEALQVNDIFAAAGLGLEVTRNHYLVVTSTAPVFPYVTVIDNQSGDSVFVPASADEAP